MSRKALKTVLQMAMKVCVLYFSIFWFPFVYALLFCLVLKCDAEGGLKRMGGQGDILSGAIAAFLAWGKAYEDGVWR